MTFAAPGFLVAAFAVAATVALLHLLVLRPPPASRLPTARFVPAAPSVVRRRETWPKDRALLALRAATILSAGLGFSGPAFGVGRAPFTRIVVIDRSSPTARDSVVRSLRSSDVLIPFDTGAFSLSAALVAARRAAATLRADSIELIIVSPFATSAVDAATAALRAEWPAAIRTVRVAAPPMPVHRAVVHWAAPAGAVDTIGAVIMGDIVAVAPFTRARASPAPQGRVVARWVDGAPAAVDRSLGDSCEREIAIGMPDTREVEPLRTALTNRPCGGRTASTPMSDSALRVFAGSGPLGATFGPTRGGDRTIMTILLARATVLAIVEWVVRR